MNDGAWLEPVKIQVHMEKAKFLYVVFTVFVLLMFGCAHDHGAPKERTVDVKSLVQKEISDPVRADKIVALMEQLNAELNMQKQATLDIQQELARLNADYDATPEQFRKLMDSSTEYREKTRSKILDTYFQIKALTTPQEWEAISKAEVQEVLENLKKREIQSIK